MLGKKQTTFANSATKMHFGGGILLQEPPNKTPQHDVKRMIEQLLEPRRILAKKNEGCTSSFGFFVFVVFVVYSCFLNLLVVGLATPQMSHTVHHPSDI
jgi:hypothetical protein